MLATLQRLNVPSKVRGSELSTVLSPVPRRGARAVLSAATPLWGGWRQGQSWSWSQAWSRCQSQSWSLVAALNPSPPAKLHFPGTCQPLPSATWCLPLSLYQTPRPPCFPHSLAEIPTPRRAECQSHPTTPCAPRAHCHGPGWEEDSCLQVPAYSGIWPTLPLSFRSFTELWGPVRAGGVERHRDGFW